MTILVHKGYQGSIEYEDGHIVIQLLHIDDFVSTNCDDAKLAEITFHSLVEEYLETCSKLGKEPDKPYKGSLNVRMPADLHRSLAKAATQEGVSLNLWIVNACRAKLSADTLAPGAAILGEDQTSLFSIISTKSDSLSSSPSLRQPHSHDILAPFLRSPTAIQQQLGAAQAQTDLVHSEASGAKTEIPPQGGANIIVLADYPSPRRTIYPSQATPIDDSSAAAFSRSNAIITGAVSLDPASNIKEALNA